VLAGSVVERLLRIDLEELSIVRLHEPVLARELRSARRVDVVVVISLVACTAAFGAALFSLADRRDGMPTNFITWSLIFAMVALCAHAVPTSPTWNRESKVDG
jgi:hypothetical protein